MPPPTMMMRFIKREKSGGCGSCFADDVCDHLDEKRVVSDRLGAKGMDAGFLRGGPSFYVEVKQHFHVVGDKTDGNQKGAALSTDRLFFKDITDIRFEPRILGPAAPAGVSESPLFYAKFLTDEL